MASPFDVLDSHKKRQNGSDRNNILNVSTNNVLKRSTTLPVLKKNNAFPGISRAKSDLNENRAGSGRKVLQIPEKTSSTPSSISSTLKTSKLASVLRRESKFSNRLSVVSRTTINKKSPAFKVSRPSSASLKLKSRAGGSFLQPTEDVSVNKVTRAMPWEIQQKTHYRIKIEHSNSKKGGDQNTNSQNLVPISTTVDGIDLSPEQIEVLNVVLNERKNVFFTGSAGTGKSFLLKLLIKKLQTRYGKSSIGISAPTGLAASNVGGQTIQRLFGIGLGLESQDILLSRIKKSQEKYNVWRRMNVLIIDEISMLDSILFDKLNYLAKKIKRSERPFGGIQVIICGDFLQLPPVNANNSSSINYAFKSKAWGEVVDRSILLNTVFRQKGDHDLIDILNSLRIGKVDYKIESKLKRLSRDIVFDDGIEPTELFPTRKEVEESNFRKLTALKGELFVYNAEDESPMGIPIDENAKKQLDLLNCVPTLQLKIGAQVMLLKNDIDYRLVNGQLGKVLTFVTKSIMNSFNARFNSDYSRANLEVLVKIGQMISDKKNINGTSIEYNLSLVDPFTAEIMREIMKSYDPRAELLPFVRFSVNDGKHVFLLIEKSEFRPKSNKPTDDLFLRKQLPIVLSWAMSIHKSQGQTLQRVKIDLRKVFEKGQLYVAISRCVSSHGLQVLNFDRRKVFVDQEVISFYNSVASNLSQ